MASNYWKCRKCRTSNQYWNRKCDNCRSSKQEVDNSDDEDDTKDDRRKNGYTRSRKDREKPKQEYSGSKTSKSGRRRKSSSPRDSRHSRDKGKQKDTASRRHSSSPRRDNSYSRRKGRKDRRADVSDNSSDGSSDSDYKTGRSKRYDRNDEIRIVLLGKTGSGKSASGNTILKGDYFSSAVSGASVTKLCKRRHAERFGKSIHVIDTPGVFDTSTPQHIITKEIVKCIGISSPGPHVFIVVVSIGRFTQEEEESVQHFVDTFGEDVYDYMIVLFTRKDDLDHENVTLKEHVKTVPKPLKTLLKKCSNRYIAFNNRAHGRENNEQVKELLHMVNELKKTNRGDYYTNDMFDEAERVMQEREDEIRREQREATNREKKRIEKEVGHKYKKEISRHLDIQQELETRIAELESKRSHKKQQRRKRRGTLEREIDDLKRQISRAEKAGENTKHMRKKLEDMEREKEMQERDEGKDDKETNQQVEELRQELENMRSQEKEMMRDRDKQLKKQLRDHERKFKELEKKGFRNKARDEVEKEEKSLGDKILGGITALGKALLKIFL